MVKNFVPQVRDLQEDANFSDQEKLIVASNKTSPIFKINLTTLPFHLSVMSNKKLLHQFKRVFIALNDYKPEDELEKTHILEIGRLFKEEFYYRIDDSTLSELKEFIKIMTENLEQDKTIGATFYTRYLLRFRSHAINILKWRGYDKKALKKEFL